VANIENLIPLNKRTQRERKEIASKGAQACNEGKRKKKTMREMARAIADSEVEGKSARQKLIALGVGEEDLTNNALVTARIWESAVGGNVKAFEKWQELLAEEENREIKQIELPARLLASSFVDLNRAVDNEPDGMEFELRGGRGSTKSSYISLKIIELLTNHPNMHAVCVRRVSNTLKDSVYAQIVWAIGQLGLEADWEATKSPLLIKNIHTQQNIYFRGADDPGKLKSIKPQFGYVGVLWIEELDQLPGPEAVRNIEQSILRGGDITYVFKSYNPPRSQSAWVNQARSTLGKQVRIHVSDYLSVPREWLGKKFLEDAAHLAQVNEKAYQHEYLGIPVGTGGAVFEFLEARAITEEEEKALDRFYQGVDWGWYPDPYAFVRCSYRAANETIYILDEYYANKQSNAETGKWIIDHGYADEKTVCDSAEKKSVSDYREMGIIATPAYKPPGSVNYGMKWLCGKKIVVDPQRTPNTYRELSRYEYERDKDGNIVTGYPDANNHTIDALRYALSPLFLRKGSRA